MGYDFGRTFTETYTGGSSAQEFVRTDVRMLDGLIGPKFQTRGKVRLFVTVKGGITHFDLSNSPASISGFTSEVPICAPATSTLHCIRAAESKASSGPWGYAWMWATKSISPTALTIIYA